MNKTARLISIIFVPPSFTILWFVWFALFNETEATKQMATIFTALIFGFVLHIISFFYFRKRELIADIDASIKEERTLPYIISVIFYIIGFIILTYYEADILSRAFWFCYITNTFFITIINKRWKISAHAMGAAGPIAALTFLTGFYGLLFLPLLMVIGLSRIKLKCHNYSEVIAGSLLGFFSTYIQMWIFILNS